jgi:hypothetical protein
MNKAPVIANAVSNLNPLRSLDFWLTLVKTLAVSIFRNLGKS